MKNFFKIIITQSKLVILIYILLGIFLGIYSIKNLKINTSTDSLINNNLDFKLNQKNLKKSFDILNNNILIRIKSLDKSKTSEICIKIVEELTKISSISFVYSPNLDKVFKKNFFLFLNEIEKEEIVNKLYKYQPFLSQINNSKSKLGGFNNLIEMYLKDDSNSEENQFDFILETFSESLTKRDFVNWQNLFSSEEEEFFIIFGVNENHISNKNFKEIYTFLNSLNNKYHSDIVVDYTGGLVIDYEEVSSVSEGAIVSGLLSFLLVGLILWLAFRIFLPIFLLLFTIFLGLVITIGVTTFVIGSLNLISVAFAVLFIGLSVDFGIQVFSRITEDRFTNEIKNIDLISKTLFIASIPSVIGFLSFIPTDYIGLSELGMISAIGLMVGLILNISFLPCIIKVFSNNLKITFFNFSSNSFIKFLQNKKKINITKFIFISVLFFSLLNFKKINFDSDALNLKNQESQSVLLAKEVIEKNPTSDYVASIIFNDQEINLFDKSHPIFQNKIIKSYFSYYKIYDNYESENLDYLKFLLTNNNPSKLTKKNSELKRFKELLFKLDKENDSIESSSFKLLQVINELEKQGLQTKDIEKLLFEKFDDLILFIQDLGNVPEGLSNSIPNYFKKRYVSESGMHRVEIFPSKDLSEPNNLNEFVQVIESYFPEATGMPVVQQKAGEVVINSFFKALTISLIFLIFFLFFIFKKFKHVLMCLLTLFSGFILTTFFMIILKINFNFANMIALPLLFSLGVSYPIYFLKRYDELKSIESVYESNTPSAILFSGLTTICSFSTLYLSNHQGTSSMGLLLFFSLFNTLISCLVLLPIYMRLSKFK